MSKKIVRVGNLNFGNGEIYVQSMLNVSPDDVDGNVEQAKRIVSCGCDVIRVAVPEKRDVRLIDALKNAVNVPIVADIHFDYRIAVEAVNAGADKIRINPGNIGGDDRVKAVVDACLGRSIPVRVGVNAGSVKDGESIVASAMGHIRLLERFDFNDIIVSVKSSGVVDTINAYHELSRLSPYPLHLGVTEAGTWRQGLIKSAVGIGSLLCDGIGDTIRVSLTDEPEKEVVAAIDILKAIGKRKGIEVISCPTCGRCRIDVVRLAGEVETLLAEYEADIKNKCNDVPSFSVAVMGCAVNGPGECKNADFGITGGDGVGLIFKKGEIVKKVNEADLLSALMEAIRCGVYENS